MRFEVKTGKAARQQAGCLVVPVYSAGPLPSSSRALDAAAGGLISDLRRAGDLTGEAGETLLLPAVPGVSARRSAAGA